MTLHNIAIWNELLMTFLQQFFSLIVLDESIPFREHPVSFIGLEQSPTETGRQEVGGLCVGPSARPSNSMWHIRRKQKCNRVAGKQLT